MLERDIVTALLRKTPGCFTWKEHGGMYDTAAIPDIRSLMQKGKLSKSPWRQRWPAFSRKQRVCLINDTPMTAKDYLSRAYYIDQRINAKLEHTMSPRELVTKATGILSDMAQSDSLNTRRC